MLTKRVFRAAFVSSLPVLMGYTAMGMAAGILLVGTAPMKCTPFWAFLSSAINISGALQFIMCDWALHLTPLTEVALLTFCLNVRYAMYGLSLLERFRGLPWYTKCYLIWSLTDETYALEVENKTPPGENPVTYALLVASLDHLYWIGGVVAGAAIGSHLPFDNKGIDFAMTALFLVVLTEQCRNKSNRLSALTGAAAALIGLLTVGKANMLIVAMVLMTVTFVVFRKYFDKPTAKEQGE